MLIVLLVILIKDLYFKHTTEFISYVVISVIVVVSYNLSKKKVSIKNRGTTAISPRTKFILYFLLNILLWVIIVIAIAMGTVSILALFSCK
jgi:chromate transport protein ChrA